MWHIVLCPCLCAIIADDHLSGQPKQHQLKFWFEGPQRETTVLAHRNTCSPLCFKKRCLQVFTVLLLNLVTVVVIVVIVCFSVCLSANCTIAKLVVHWQIAHNLLSLLDAMKSVCCHKLFLAVWPICLTLWEADNWSASSCRLHSQAPICARISGCNLLRKSTFFVCLPWSVILYRSSRCSLSLEQASGANATTKWLWCKWAEEGALARDRQTQSVAVRECASTAHLIVVPNGSVINWLTYVCSSVLRMSCSAATVLRLFI